MSTTISGDTGVSAIQDGTVTTDKVVDNAITQPKLSGVVFQQMELLASQSASSTSVDFSGIQSWANKVTVNLSQVSTNGTSRLLIQLGTGGGVQTTGYESTSLARAGITIQAAGNSTAGFIFNGDPSTLAISGTYVFTRLTSNTWVGSGLFKDSTTRMEWSAGDVVLSDVLTSVRVTTEGGVNTFDAGTISVLVEGVA